jgi:hypothetical protein
MDNGEKQSWFKKKTFRISLAILGLLAVVAVVLFNQQISHLLELIGSRAATNKTIFFNDWYAGEHQGTMVDERGFLVLRNPKTSDKSVAIFVDDATYGKIQSEVSRFQGDIIRDTGMDAEIVVGNWTNASAVKNIIRDKYNTNGLVGAILVGDIPSAYFEYQNSGATLTDWYLQDLSTQFVDTDGDGKFEREYYMHETDITHREIWTSRIKPPVSGDAGIALLKDYFNRNHAFRAGELSYDKKMLFFNSPLINHKDDDIADVTQSEYMDLVRSIDDFTGFYSSDSSVDYVYDQDLQAQKDEYLDKLANNSYEFVFVNIHGDVTRQWLGGDVNVYANEIRDAQPNTFFVELASCSNGKFTDADYFAGTWLFSGKTLVVAANTEVSFLPGQDKVNFLNALRPLRLGVPFGQQLINDNGFLVRHLFGDPTLQLRAKPQQNIPKIEVSQKGIDFGTINKGEDRVVSIRFSNKGNRKLTVEKYVMYESVDSKPIDGDWGFVTYLSGGETWGPIEVPVGDSVDVPFTLKFPANIPGNEYTAIQVLLTNDPNMPYLELTFKGVAT